MEKHRSDSHPEIRDFGPMPLIFNINHAATRNQNFRTVLWTGTDMQLTLMSIPPKESIGIEMHPNVDQFIRIVSGHAKVYMGSRQNGLEEKARVDGNDAIMIPRGTWHNIVNAGTSPLKLYSIYAPPNHSFGTVHQTKEDAQHEEN